VRWLLPVSCLVHSVECWLASLSAVAASIWVLCDAMRSMTKKFLPHFKRLLPVYESWVDAVDARSQRSVASAIKVLESV
jgi:hypothetical protein